MQFLTEVLTTYNHFFKETETEVFYVNTIFSYSRTIFFICMFWLTSIYPWLITGSQVYTDLRENLAAIIRVRRY